MTSPRARDHVIEKSPDGQVVWVAFTEQQKAQMNVRRVLEALFTENSAVSWQDVDVSDREENYRMATVNLRKLGMRREEFEECLPAVLRIVGLEKNEVLRRKWSNSDALFLAISETRMGAITATAQDKLAAMKASEASR